METKNRMQEENNNFKRLFEIADMKDIPHYKIFELLHQEGWESILHSPNPNFPEWGNTKRREMNRMAVERVLTMIDYMI